MIITSNQFYRRIKQKCIQDATWICNITWTTENRPIKQILLTISECWGMRQRGPWSRIGIEQHQLGWVNNCEKKSFINITIFNHWNISSQTRRPQWLSMNFYSQDSIKHIIDSKKKKLIDWIPEIDHIQSKYGLNLKSYTFLQYI